MTLELFDPVDGSAVKESEDTGALIAEADVP
jgi:hypothetical protein